MTKRYFASEIESKWQQLWEEQQIYRAEEGSKKPKKYVLDMFPYPSGEGMHVGHPKGYVATDIISRFYRMKGFNVLHPMGWDAFGLPAENYAIKTGIHPRLTTVKNIANIKRQMNMIGLSYDWSREIDTTDPAYYKWTQWIFLKLFERGLAYEAETPINWCPKDKTGLANEEVVNGACERCGTPVERKVLRQWILKITEYADRLLEDLQDLDWPQSIKDMQINWIGRSEGTIVKFELEKGLGELECFTTRIDTLYGVTAVVLAPEHPLVPKLIADTDQKASVEAYLDSVKSKSDLERTELNKEKSGVFTGTYAINPASNERIPVWVADYVLGFYGTGAVMFVPAHDQRDGEFASKYNIPSKIVIDEQKQVLVDSGQFTGLTAGGNFEPKSAKQLITEWLKERNKGDKQVQYKLRDWIFSRQRYWGEPIPLIHCAQCGIVPVPEDQLPVTLPEVEKYEPTGTGESPLSGIDEWVNTSCPKCTGPAKRETNTMPQWAGSCWYYLRFIDPHNSSHLVGREAEKYWMPTDWYVGGAEHAVLHLLYSRFWHKVLYDIGSVSSKEPFMRLNNVGMVLGPDGQKMSKSRPETLITPDQMVEEYGADTLRVYEGFIGPFDNAIAWDPTSVSGVYRFLCRFWEVILKDHASENSASIDVLINRLIYKVESDIEKMKFNTAVAGMMELINEIFNQVISLEQKKKLVLIIAPFAPHLAEELWAELGQSFSVHQQSWPAFDPSLLEDDQVTITIQVNGKVRDIVSIKKDMVSEQAEVEKLALASEKVQRFVKSRQPQRIIYIPGKVLNVVISE